MQNYKPEITEKIKNIEVLLSIMDKNLEYYKAVDDPNLGHIVNLDRIEASLKQLLDNE